MAFHSMTEFLQMGGYAGYVWPAYSVCLLGFFVYAVNIKRKKTSLISLLKARHESKS